MFKRSYEQIDEREGAAIETESLFTSIPTICDTPDAMSFRKTPFNPIRSYLETNINRRMEKEGRKTLYSETKDIKTNFNTENRPKKCATEEDVYENNSGTSLALIVENKLIIAADTRHSAEYNINSRKMSKIFRIGNFFLATTGFYADSFEVYTRMLYEIKQYETYKKISLKAAAHLLMNILYSRRFFPLYTFATISGYENGKAFIYSFDCVGSYESVKCRCDGSGAPMIQPLLDSWVSGKNFENYKPLTFEAAVMLVKKAFDATAERDVKTKDWLELYVLDGESIDRDLIPLRKD